MDKRPKIGIPIAMYKEVGNFFQISNLFDKDSCSQNSAFNTQFGTNIACTWRLRVFLIVKVVG